MAGICDSIKKIHWSCLLEITFCMPGNFSCSIFTAADSPLGSSEKGSTMINIVINFVFARPLPHRQNWKSSRLRAENFKFTIANSQMVDLLLWPCIRGFQRQQREGRFYGPAYVKPFSIISLPLHLSRHSQPPHVL